MQRNNNNEPNRTQQSIESNQTITISKSMYQHQRKSIQQTKTVNKRVTTAKRNKINGNNVGHGPTEQ